MKQDWISWGSTVSGANSVSGDRAIRAAKAVPYIYAGACSLLYTCFHENLKYNSSF